MSWDGSRIDFSIFQLSMGLEWQPSLAVKLAMLHIWFTTAHPACASSPVQSPVLSVTSLTSLDECSPLLSTTSHHEFKGYTFEDAIPAKPHTEQLDARKLLWVMSSVWIGTFCAGLDSTIMATLAAPIATSFNSLSLLAWLATAFLIGQAATQPLSGKLTDIFSRSSGLVVSNCLFALGNLICGFAREKWSMILGRVLAGMGGGGLNAMATIIASDFIPLRQRGLWQGIGNIFLGLGSGLGGVLGGFIHDVWNWNIAFLAQVPLTLISLLIIWSQLDTIRSKGPRKPSSSQSSLSRVDFLGSFTLVSSLVLLLLGLTTGGNIVPWTHPLATVSIPLSAVLFGCFIVVEQKTAREPILPLHLLHDRTVLCACLTNFFVNLTVYVFIFYIPIYYRLRGTSTTKAGMALIPYSVTFPIGSLLSGLIITKTGRYKQLFRANLLLMLFGAVASCTNTLSNPLWPPTVYLAIVGLATGGMFTIILVALIGAVDPSEQAVVTSLSYVFRSTGSVVGLAFASTVYQSVLEADLWKKIGHIKQAAKIIRGIKDSLDDVDGLPSSIQWPVRTSYMLALKATFITTVAFAAMALVSGLLVKDLKLDFTLAREEQDEESDRTSLFGWRAFVSKRIKLQGGEST